MVLSTAKHNKLLVVDDEEMILSLLRSWLDRETNYECFFASCGEEALKIFQENPCDVVLTDVRMPGMSGIDLLKEVNKINPGVAVIVMSGFAEFGSVVDALREGVVDFFRKPFEIKTVLECLNRTFQRLNVEYSRNQAYTYLVSESRAFKIPNDFDAADQITLDLTQYLSEKGFGEEPLIESLRVSLNEMIINSIEHGNLEIGYDGKSRIIENFEEYAKFLKERAAQPKYKDRYVTVEYSMTPKTVKFVIRDQGKGFDHQNLPDPTNPENLLSCHGRGILMTRIYMDEVRYNDAGNEVTLIKHRHPETPDSSG